MTVAEAPQMIYRHLGKTGLKVDDCTSAHEQFVEFDVHVYVILTDCDFISLSHGI